MVIFQFAILVYQRVFFGMNYGFYTDYKPRIRRKTGALCRYCPGTIHGSLFLDGQDPSWAAPRGENWWIWNQAKSVDSKRQRMWIDVKNDVLLKNI